MIVNVDIPLIDFGYGITYKNTRAVLSKRKPAHKSRDYPHSNIVSNMWKKSPTDFAASASSYSAPFGL